METGQKIALITGGSRGIGKAIALRLAEAGNNIIFTYRNQEEEANAVVTQIEQAGQQAIALKLDTGIVGSFDAFIETVKSVLQSKWGRTQLNFLVNNAGHNTGSAIAETSETAFDDLVNVHFKGAYFLTQKVVPLLADGGSIVNMSTALTRYAAPGPGQAVYSSVKAAVETFTKFLAVELGSRGIRANSVAPALIVTDMNAALLDTPGIDDYLIGQTALGRLGQPNDVADIVVFLCSDNARWVTAQRIEASGGFML